MVLPCIAYEAGGVGEKRGGVHVRFDRPGYPPRRAELRLRHPPAHLRPLQRHPELAGWHHLPRPPPSGAAGSGDEQMAVPQGRSTAPLLPPHPARLTSLPTTSPPVDH